MNAIPKFREFIEEHGQQFIEMVDDWLKDHRNLEADPARQVRLGLGIFLIQDDSSKDD